MDNIDRNEIRAKIAYDSCISRDDDPNINDGFKHGLLRQKIELIIVNHDNLFEGVNEVFGD